jgi:hypothetical protein
MAFFVSALASISKRVTIPLYYYLNLDLKSGTKTVLNGTVFCGFHQLKNKTYSFGFFSVNNRHVSPTTQVIELATIMSAQPLTPGLLKLSILAINGI